MKRVKFKSNFFYWIIVVLIMVLVIGNSLQVVSSFRALTLVDIGVTIFLLILILSKNRFAKIALQLWALIFLIASPIVKAVISVVNRYELSNEFLLYAVVINVIGILILWHSVKSISIEE